MPSIGAEEHETYLLHAIHYETILSAADELYQQGGESTLRSLALFDLEWPNIQAGQAWAAAHVGEDERAARLCSAYPGSPYLLNLRSHPRDRIGWIEAALMAARRMKDRGTEGGHLGNLGSAYADLGERRRAIGFFEQHQDIAREIGDRHGEGNALWNMSLSLDKLGNRAEAIVHAQAALEICEQIEDPHADMVWKQLEEWRAGMVR